MDLLDPILWPQFFRAVFLILSTSEYWLFISLDWRDPLEDSKM
jgi:hypothetical protein